MASTGQLEPRLHLGGRFLSGTRLRSAKFEEFTDKHVFESESPSIGKAAKSTDILL